MTTEQTNKMMTRLVADLCFTNMRDAIDAVAELEKNGYEVIISHEVIDVLSGAVFAEAYKDVAGDGELELYEMRGQIMPLAKSCRGFCNNVWPVSPPHHVPFQEYVENQAEIDAINNEGRDA